MSTTDNKKILIVGANGAEFIGEIVLEEKHYVEMKNCYNIQFIQTKEGIGVAFVNFSPEYKFSNPYTRKASDKEIEVYDEHIRREMAERSGITIATEIPKGMPQIPNLKVVK